MSTGAWIEAQYRRMMQDRIDYPNDPFGYAERVRELEAEGMTTSDAQGVADVEFGMHHDYTDPVRTVKYRGIAA